MKGNNNSSKNTVLIVLIIAIAVVAIVFICKDNFKNDNKNESNTSSSNTTKNETNTSSDNTTNATSGKTENKTNTNTSNSNNNSSSNSSSSQTSNQNTNTSSASNQKLYIGTTSNFKTYDITIDESLSVEDQAKYLIEQVGQKLGCSISINEIYSGKGGMTIDLKSNSSPLTETNSTTVYSVFDSIKQTLQQYFGTTMDVYFSVEEKDITISTISPTFTISSTSPYPGSGK